MNNFNLLTEEQLSTCIKNFAYIRHFGNVEMIYNGKVSNNEKAAKPLKELNIALPKGNKSSSTYTIYKFSNIVENDSVRELREYNYDIKIKNLNNRVEFMIVLNTEKVDKVCLTSLVLLYHLMENDLTKNNGYVINKNVYQTYIPDDSETFITIALTTPIDQTINRSLTLRYLPCNYNFISLYSIYPLIGSKSKLWYGMCCDFELCEYEELYNHKNYASIYNDELVVKILNGKIGDLIICKIILNEGRPYFEYSIKRIISRNNDDILDLE